MIWATEDQRSFISGSAVMYNSFAIRWIIRLGSPLAGDLSFRACSAPLLSAITVKLGEGEGGRDRQGSNGTGTSGNAGVSLNHAKIFPGRPRKWPTPRTFIFIPIK